MKYVINGQTLPVVICNLEQGETMITERGSMSWMSPNIVMKTSSNGGIGKAIGRVFAGESLFQNLYTSENSAGVIAFASSFPGCIRAFEITRGNDIIVQKSGFLASTSGVELSVFFQKKIGSGLFAGEGFIMQRLSGEGTAFVEFDGYVMEYSLEAGQSMIINTGYLAAMDSTCSMDVHPVSGIKNIVLGGEGLFNTVVTGPGRIFLQTMPICRLASSINPYIISQTK